MYILLQKFLQSFIPDYKDDKRDNIYENLNLITPERIFNYIVLFIVIVVVVHSLPIEMKHIFAIIISAIILYIYIQKDTQNQLDVDGEYKLKYTFFLLLPNVHKTPFRYCELECFLKCKNNRSRNIHAL